MERTRMIPTDATDVNVTLHLHIVKMIEELDHRITTLSDERDRRYMERFTERDARYTERVEGVYKHFETKMSAFERGIDLAFAAAKEAALKVETAQQERNRLANEFRSTLDDYVKGLITLSEANERFKEMRVSIDQRFQAIAIQNDQRRIDVDKSVDELTKRMHMQEGRDKTENKTQTTVLAVAALIVAISAVIIPLVLHATP